MISPDRAGRPSLPGPELLRRDSPGTGVPAFLDRNLMRITPTCLFMRTATGRVYGGRGGMSWAASLGFSLFFWICTSVFCIAYMKSDLAGLGLDGVVDFFLDGGWQYIGMSFLVPISCFWMFIPWRRQLPLIFNRETGLVTAEYRGKIVTQDWATLRAAAGSVMSVAASGVAMREGVISILFDVRAWDDKDIKVNVNIYATEHHVDVYRHGPGYGALMVWEAIRHYMNGDDGAISTNQRPDDAYRFKKWSDPFVIFNPFQNLWPETRWLRPFAPLGLLLAVPVCSVIIPGELLYMWLGRVLPRRNWPQEMVDACGGIWDGSDD